MGIYQSFDLYIYLETLSIGILLKLFKRADPTGINATNSCDMNAYIIMKLEF
jgi:hypothetical protein